MKLRNILYIFTACASVALLIPRASADLDWGGGFTQFYSKNGVLLTQDTGYGVLLAVSEGDLIDFGDFIPNAPTDLLEPGSELRHGESLNRVLALSDGFYSGYLLFSAVEDISTQELYSMGVGENDRFYLVIWDRNTFQADAPIDSSYYTVLPLYLEGDVVSPATADLSPDSVYAVLAYPDVDLSNDRTDAASLRAGHNRIVGFSSWYSEQFGAVPVPDVQAAELLDTDRDGRSDFEEYVFAAVPRIGAGFSGEAEGSALGDAIEGAKSTSSQQVGMDFYVDLRASDLSLRYTAHASSDLSEWVSTPIVFADGEWQVEDQRFTIKAASYKGEGLWSLVLDFQADEPGRLFYKMSAVQL